ncbi:MAG: HAD domain-containing protein [Lachnospiraceae bacterium]|nr:HAD domain-containing protein [Lachnospiraceae bacterium]
MKVIFLDVDGVMNSIDNEWLDLKCVDNLHMIVKATDAKVVITSSWRTGWYKEAEKKHMVSPEMAALEHAMNDLGMEIYDKTRPQLGGIMDFRGNQIKDYIEDHSPIESFVVIDDIFFPDFGQFEDRLVLTDFDEGGLTMERAQEAIYILNHA